MNYLEICLKKLTSNGYFLFPFASLATRTAKNQAVIRILQQINDIQKYISFKRTQISNLCVI
jgi:hypothetical protein